jgi:hypothetical protein
MSVSNQLITKLKELKKDNSIGSYSHIKNILFYQVIPVFCAEFRPHKIIRYRKHNSENRDILFKTSEDLTYRKDILDISNFGRANEPGQGFFYCNDNKNQDTGISEIVSVLRGNADSEEEVLTIGAWNLNQSLKLAIILPLKSSFLSQEELKNMEIYYSQIAEGNELKEIKKFVNFIAEEYYLDTDKDNSNYKITAAFSNYVRDVFPEIDGIMYSSIKSEHTGINVVLWPETADNKLEFAVARKTVFKKTQDKTFVEEVIAESKAYNIKSDIITW